MTESSVDGIEDGVAIGGVDKSMEGGGEGERGAEVGETEVGSIGLAVGSELAQGALELAGGGEDSGDAFEVREVGVVEGVLAGDGALSGVCDDPRTEATGGVDSASWERIGEVGDKVHGAGGADVGEGEVSYGDFKGKLAGLVGFKNQVCAGAVDGFDLK